MINPLSIKLSKKTGCHAEPRRSMRAKGSPRVALPQAIHDGFSLKVNNHHVIARNEAIAYYTERTEGCRTCTAVMHGVRLPRCARNDIFFKL
jgi:hypothetical protein